jgi:hypothetical protein
MAFIRLVNENEATGQLADDYETFFEWSVLSLITTSDRPVRGFAEFVSGSTHPDVGRISDDDAEPFANTDEIRNATFGPFIEIEQFLTLPPTLILVATPEALTAGVDEEFTVSLTASGGTGPLYLDFRRRRQHRRRRANRSWRGRQRDRRATQASRRTCSRSRAHRC